MHYIHVNMQHVKLLNHIGINIIKAYIIDHLCMKYVAQHNTSYKLCTKYRHTYIVRILILFYVIIRSLLSCQIGGNIDTSRISVSLYPLTPSSNLYLSPPPSHLPSPLPTTIPNTTLLPLSSPPSAHFRGTRMVIHATQTYHN